jgi:hypothetical protein
MAAAEKDDAIESGLMHPSFRQLFSMVATRAQRERVEQALGTTLGQGFAAGAVTSPTLKIFAPTASSARASRIRNMLTP